MPRRLVAALLSAALPLVSAVPGLAQSRSVGAAVGAAPGAAVRIGLPEAGPSPLAGLLPAPAFSLGLLPVVPTVFIGIGQAPAEAPAAGAGLLAGGLDRRLGQAGPAILPVNPAAAVAAGALVGTAARETGGVHGSLAVTFSQLQVLDAERLPLGLARGKAASPFDGAAPRSVAQAVAPLGASFAHRGPPSSGEPGGLQPHRGPGRPADSRRPPPSGRPSFFKLRRWHKIALGIVLAAVTVVAAWQLLGPRLRPVQPPPTNVVTELPYKMERDPVATVDRQVDAASPKRVFSLLGHKDTVESVTVSADGSAAVTVAKDGSWRAWDLEKGESFSAVDYPGKARGALFADGGRSLVLLDQDSTVRVIDLETNEVRVISQNVGGLTLHSFSPDAQRVAVASKDGVVQILDVRSATPQAFQADGKLLLLGSTSKGTLLLTAKRGIHRLIFVAPGQEPVVVGERYIPGAKVIAAAHSEDGGKVAVAADMAADQGVVFWEVGANEIKLFTAADLGETVLDIAAIAMGARGENVAILSADGRLWLWTPGAGHRLVGRSQAGAKVFFSPDGKRLYTTEPGGPVHAWSLEP